MKLKLPTKKYKPKLAKKVKASNHCPTPQQPKNLETKNRKEVTAAKLKSNFEKAESHFVHPKPQRKNKCSNKTCLHKKQVSNQKVAMNLLN